MWYNSSNPSIVVPWLAQNYTTSPDGKTLNFTLRSGIKFADGEPFNASSVYFSMNRLLVFDGNTLAIAPGIGLAWVVQQLLNTSLSSNLCCHQNYSQTWLNKVLGENFIQVTGQYTFTMHLQHPKGSLPYIFAGMYAPILAPQFTMQNDIALWSQASNGYTLPYAKLSGTLQNMSYQYYMDEISTCFTGATKAACGLTYYATSVNGSMAGTGPYYIQSINTATNEILLKANSAYWGGPFASKIAPQIGTIDIKYVPSATTREIDFQNAAKSGQAMTVDVSSAQLYDFVNRNDWLNNGSLVSTISGANAYGPEVSLNTLDTHFATNVTDPLTGQPYSFQPFSDLRFRLAFADSINVSDIERNTNNNLGKVANEIYPPGLPPSGVYNSSVATRYSFNLTGVQNLLLDAMLHPILHFTFFNGTTATAGVFNNTFGCPALAANGQCSHPVTQSLSLYYQTGDSVGQAIMEQVSTVFNNISSTYNMGLTFGVVPLPAGQFQSYTLSGHSYAYGAGWFIDYPWVLDPMVVAFSPRGVDVGATHLNVTALNNLFNQAVAADNAGNATQLISVSNSFMEEANSLVLRVWLVYPDLAWAGSSIAVFTSTVKGYGGISLNPAAFGIYFPSLY
jgi:ABC-type transport system substrate-binding protein